MEEWEAVTVSQFIFPTHLNLDIMDIKNCWKYYISVLTDAGSSFFFTVKQKFKSLYAQLSVQVPFTLLLQTSVIKSFFFWLSKQTESYFLYRHGLWQE